MRARSTLAGGLILLCGMAAGAQPASPSAWTLAHLPDTQYYSEQAALFPFFTGQTLWIRSNLSRHNIAFVSHIGDIVEHGGTSSEWTRALQALNVLESGYQPGTPAIVPYCVTCGNHDYMIVSDKNSGTALYDAAFGPHRYADEPWYLGASPSNRNHAQRFSAGGRTYINLSLDWRPTASDFAWAQAILDANPGLPAIISTHEHVKDANTDGTGAGRSAAGQATWDSFVRDNNAIFMVINGHFASGVNNHDGEYHQQATNDFGRPVLEILADYQAWDGGGSGYMRLIRFDERNHTIQVRSFSPSVGGGTYLTDTNSDYRFAWDFAARFDNAPSRLRTLTFREGLGGYTGTHDTELRQNAAGAGSPQASGTYITVDSDDPNGSFDDAQGLIRFDGVFGTQAGRVAPDSDILQGTLRVWVAEPGAGFTVHQMLTPWSEATATWNSLVGGVTADGSEAVAFPDAVAGAEGSFVSVPIIPVDLDVTSSLRAMHNGAANHGWALVPFAGNTNAVDVASSENFDPLRRPTLTIVTPGGRVTTHAFQNGVGGYGSSSDVGIRASSPTTSSAASTTLVVGSDEPVGTGGDAQVLLRFDNLFGRRPGQVPLSGQITSAVLVLSVAEPGSGLSVHPMLQGWSSTSTWASMGGGVQANDVEAAIYGEAGAGANGPGAVTPQGALILDVTDTVRAWYDGSRPNHGWAILPRPLGTDSLSIWTSDAAANLAPRLIIRHTNPMATPQIAVP